jgi:hypothetical protein
MADPPTRARLDRECAAYARYLTGHAVAGYVLGKYADAHQRHQVLNAATAARFDRFLVSVAALYPLGTWLVDVYTAVFFKPAVVRKKWVLLVAILESAAPTAQFFDRPDPGGLVAAVARLAWRGVTFVVGLLLSSVLFLPVQLLVGRPAAPSSPAGTH